MNHRRLRLFWLTTSSCLALVGCLLFVSGSSRLFVAHLGSLAARWSTLYPLANTLAFVGALFAFLLYRIVGIAQHGATEGVTERFWPTTEKRSLGKNRMALGIAVVLSAAIFARAASQITVPLDWDEHEHISNLADGMAWQSINPIYGTENHPIASALSFLSMKMFGASKFSARLPALVLTVAFLFVLNQMMLSSFSAPLNLFCLLALLGNGLVLYLMHSMRGYIPMMLFTLLVLNVSHSLSRSGNGLSRFRISLFPIWVGAAIFSHTFGGLFCTLTLATLILWAYRNRNSLSPIQFKQLFFLMGTLAAWLVLFTVISSFQLAHLKETGFAMTSDTPEWVSTIAPYRLFTIFGFVRNWEIKLFALAILGLAFIRFHYRTKSSLSFLDLFALVSLISIASLLHLLNVPLLEGRMLTPFLVILLIWMGTTVERIPVSGYRTMAGGAILLLITLPFALHHDHDDGLPEHFAQHESFSKTVHERLEALKVSPSERCFSFSGDPDGTKYARHFYFRNENRVENAPACHFHYHLAYELGLFGAVSTWISPPQTPVKLIYTDGYGRSWYQIFDRPLPSQPIARSKP